MYITHKAWEESHLLKYSEYLFDLWAHEQTELVAHCGKKLQVHKILADADTTCIYFMIDTSKEVSMALGFIGFCILPGWKAIETFNIFVPPKFRGTGMALMLYDAVLKDGQIVMSGWSHTKKSSGLWTKIVQNSNYIAWAHDIMNLSRLAPILIEDNKYVCDLNLYVDIKRIAEKKSEDIRIIVYHPKYIG